MVDQGNRHRRPHREERRQDHRHPQGEDQGNRHPHPHREERYQDHRAAAKIQRRRRRATTDLAKKR